MVARFNLLLTGIRVLAFLCLFICLSGFRLAVAQQLPKPLWMMNADGTELHQLVELEEHPCMGAPIWSLDGKSILFDAWGTEDDFHEAHAYIVNADGTSPKDLGIGAMPAMHRSSGAISIHKYDTLSGIWLKPHGENAWKRIASQAGSPRWNPTNDQVAYVKWSGGIVAKTISSEENSEEVVLVPDMYSPYVGFSWSPDGTAIVFYSNRSRTKQEELLLLKIATPWKEPKVLATGNIGWMTSWSGDGKKIAFNMFCEETQSHQIYVVEPETDQPAYRLKGQDPKKSNGNPAWSPDGKKIVFTSREIPPKPVPEVTRDAIEEFTFPEKE